MLIECWLREYDPDTDRYSVRMLKLAGGVLLEDSARQAPGGAIMPTGNIPSW